MSKRVLSALIGIPVLLGLTYLGERYTALLVAVIALLALREFLLLEEKMGLTPWRILTFIVAVVWLLILFCGSQIMVCGLFLWFAVACGRLALCYPRCQPSEALHNFAAVIYTVFLPGHFYLLRQMQPDGLKWAFLTFLLIWATDTFAYLVGMTIGKHLLAPKISPHKTVEGFLGGLVGSMAVGLLGWRYMEGNSWLFFAGLALLVGLGAQIGDLLESVFKRTAGVKDSGNLIPGHGGILDRFDSLIFVIPLVYYYIEYSMI
ncbi:MAG: phosphatidate cytidylyltransferase [Peptococcaceae bacterium]|jgi:phosphatidate cytidylyltransferase|nr:phosphatidate cytidylyltransferase [Peptococcaceae bacterium]